MRSFEAIWGSTENMSSATAIANTTVVPIAHQSKPLFEAGMSRTHERTRCLKRVTGLEFLVANIRTKYPLAEMPGFWHLAVDNKSVRNEMARVIDFAGDMPVSEWAQFLQDQAEDLLVLANQHEEVPTADNKEALGEALDHIEALVRGARRRLNKKGPKT